MNQQQQLQDLQWVVITGGGSGIGRHLVQKFSKDYLVLTCGRRLAAVEETKAGALDPSNITVIEADIAKPCDRERFTSSITANNRTGGTPPKVYLLIQNAAIGDPAKDLASTDLAHFEYALQVNVVAPLALVQLLLPALQRCRSENPGGGRVLHLGTSVAHKPQPGTLTYGVTKMAFHRLYQQLNAEGIVCGSMSPGLVDTEGVQDHLRKARDCGLEHVKYFDQAFQNTGWTTDLEQLFRFIQELLQMDDATFSSKEWRFSEWRRKVDHEGSSST